MKKFLHCECLRALQFFLKQRTKRKQTKHSDWLVIKETYRWPIKSFVFLNQPHALDGAIDGVIFPWLRDTRAFSVLPFRNFFIYIISK